MEVLGPLVRVQSVEPLEGFKVQLTFQNGVVKEIDLEPFLYGPTWMEETVVV